MLLGQTNEWHERGPEASPSTGGGALNRTGTESSFKRVGAIDHPIGRSCSSIPTSHHTQEWLPNALTEFIKP